MDLAFIRNQLELKLTEFETLIELYVDGLEKEFKSFDGIMEEEEKKEISDLINELKSYGDSATEMQSDFAIVVGQLTVSRMELIKLRDKIIELETIDRTTTFENITITREPLLYSQLADSIGYDKENKLLDISYTSGGIYRYYNVPEEYYKSLKTRNNLKGFRKEIAVYEVKKIN